MAAMCEAPPAPSAGKAGDEVEASEQFAADLLEEAGNGSGLDLAKVENNFNEGRRFGKLLLMLLASMAMAPQPPCQAWRR